MFDEALAQRVIQRVSEGESLRKACEAELMKAPTFLLWVKDRPSLAEQYARAREVGNDLDFERLCELTDELPERTAANTVDPGWVAWKRLQVDTAKWALSKKAPRKYGDKLSLEHEGDVGLTVKVVSFNAGNNAAE